MSLRCDTAKALLEPAVVLRCTADQDEVAQNYRAVKLPASRNT
jgi:hypothetical protein